MAEKGWETHGYHVLKELERQNDSIEGIHEELKTIRKMIGKGAIRTSSEIATLKVKSSIWGGLTGLLGGLFSGILFYLKMR